MLRKFRLRQKKWFSYNKSYTELLLSATRKETREKDDNVENKID